MKGSFKTPLIKYVYCLLFVLTCSYITIKFAVWGIDAIRSRQAAAAIFCFAFAALGLLFGVFSILLFNHNRGAFLVVNAERIDARFGLSNELHEPVSSIRKVELESGGKGVKLYFDDRAFSVLNLENAKQLCEYISTIIPDTTAEKATANLEKNQKLYKHYLLLTCALAMLMFVHIFWCVLLTEGKDLVEFSASNNIVFAAFAVAELITVIFLLVFADKCGKHNKLCALSRAAQLSAAASEHKNDSLERYPNIYCKKYFNGNTFRIVVFSPESGVFMYVLERFDLKLNAYVNSYMEPKAFASLSELYEDIDESFKDVMLED